MSDQMTREVVHICVIDIDFVVSVAYYPGYVSEWEEEGIFIEEGKLFDLSNVLREGIREVILEEVDREMEESYPQAYQ